MALGVGHDHGLVTSVLSLAQPCLGKTVKALPRAHLPGEKGLVVRPGALRFALKRRHLDHRWVTVADCALALLSVLDSMALTI